MHFISEDLKEAYIDLRIRIKDSPQPLSWTEHVKICMPKAKLMAPAKESEIQAAERSLGRELPQELKEFLRETNGIDALSDSPVSSVSEIVEMNHEFRTADHLADRMPFDHLLFFGDAGDGDTFAYPIYRNGEFGSAVFMWEHETDCRQEYASGLSDFLVHYAVQYYNLRLKNWPL